MCGGTVCVFYMRTMSRIGIRFMTMHVEHYQIKRGLAFGDLF